MQELKSLTPDIPVLSEEDPQPWSERQHWTQYWLVDPLDGTKEFISRNGEFTVNIALISDGVPVMGVVYAPYRTCSIWQKANTPGVSGAGSGWLSKW